jgi:exopolysaccharide production protein ExoQ
MATTVVQAIPAITRPPRPIKQWVLPWLLILPLAFFAVHGTPSFESAPSSTANAGPLSGLASNGRKAGMLWSVVLPGIMYSIVMWTIVTNFRRIFPMAIRMWLLTTLAGLSMLSCLWSQDPFRSAYNGCFCMIEALFAYYLVIKFTSDELRTLIMMAGLFIAVVGLFMVVVSPQYAVAHSGRDGTSWVGLFTDRTSTGKAMVFLLSPAIIFARKEFKYRRAAYILLLLFLVFMAHAATARVISVIYICLMAGIRLYTKFGRRSSIIVAAVLGLAGAAVASTAIVFLPQLLSLLGRNATLSGRTLIWTLVLRSIMKRPILGYGFYAFWLGLKGESARIITGVNWVFGYAHNGVLEIWLQLGLVGVAVFVASFIQAIRNSLFCLRRNCPSGTQWYIGIIALSIFYNVDESTVLWPIDLLTVLYMVACTGLAMAARQTRQLEALEVLSK